MSQQWRKNRGTATSRRGYKRPLSLDCLSSSKRAALAAGDPPLPARGHARTLDATAAIRAPHERHIHPSRTQVERCTETPRG